MSTTTATPRRPYGHLQFNRLAALASAHGHWWTCYAEGLSEPRPQGWTPEEVNAAASAGDEIGMGGIGAPERDILGAASHVTATGRLQWTVERDGEAVLLGSRRGDAVGRLGRDSVVVLRVVVTPSGSATAEMPLGREAVSDGVLSAVLGAAACIGAEAQARAAIGFQGDVYTITGPVGDERSAPSAAFVAWREAAGKPAKRLVDKSPVRRL